MSLVVRSSEEAVVEASADPQADGHYGNLSVDEVLSDLPNLDRDQLRLVRSLEEGGGQRPAILDRIAELLEVQETLRHLRGVGPKPVPVAPIAAPPEPVAPVAPMAMAEPASPAAPVATGNPAKPVSQDLVEQMGWLLAKDAARRATLPASLNQPG
jgi:hypothetical protein